MMVDETRLPMSAATTMTPMVCQGSTRASQMPAVISPGMGLDAPEREGRPSAATDLPVVSCVPDAVGNTSAERAWRSEASFSQRTHERSGSMTVMAWPKRPNA